MLYIYLGWRHKQARSANLTTFYHYILEPHKEKCSKLETQEYGSQRLKINYCNFWNQNNSSKSGATILYTTQSPGPLT